MGKHYTSDISDFYMNYRGRAVGDPTLTFTDGGGSYDIEEYDCHVSGTGAHEHHYGMPTPSGEDAYHIATYDQCTDLAGVTNGEANSFITFPPADTSDNQSILSENYQVSFAHTGIQESLVAAVTTKEIFYVDTQLSLDYFPVTESLHRKYEETTYDYSIASLPAVTIGEAEGKYTRTSVTGSRSGDSDYQYVSSSHTLYGCYDQSGDNPVHMATTVTVDYPTVMKMIPDTRQVVSGTVSLSAADGSKAEISATPGDTANATVLLMASFGGGTTALTIPWSELLP